LPTVSSSLRSTSYSTSCNGSDFSTDPDLKDSQKDSNGGALPAVAECGRIKKHTPGRDVPAEGRPLNTVLTTNQILIPINFRYVEINLDHRKVRCLVIACRVASNNYARGIATSDENARWMNSPYEGSLITYTWRRLVVRIVVEEPVWCFR
jgi:hypothetical protein